MSEREAPTGRIPCASRGRRRCAPPAEASTSSSSRFERTTGVSVANLVGEPGTEAKAAGSPVVHVARLADVTNRPRSVADERVRPACHQFWLLFLGHRRAPVSPDVDSGPDRESQPEGDEYESDASAPNIRIHTAASEGSQAGQDNRGYHDRSSDTQLVGPRDPALLRGEGSHEPVGPERRPPDGDEYLDGAHATHRATSGRRQS